MANEIVWSAAAATPLWIVKSKLRDIKKYALNQSGAAAAALQISRPV